MAELYPATELPDVESPPQEAPSQHPTTPPDYAIKRKNFLGKFAALDPEAKIDEAGLGAILTDDQKRDEFTSYVTKLNPKFTMSGQQLADALGYKKKADLPPVGSAAGSSASPALPAGDKEFVSVAPDSVQPAVPTRPGELRLEGTTIRIPHPGQQETPGDEYIAAHLPIPSGEELRAKEEARQKARAEVEDDGFWASFGKSLYNGLDARRVGGNVLDFFGDATEMLGRSPVIPGGAAGGVPREVAVPSPTEPLHDSKFSDLLAKDWLAAAGRTDLPLSAAAQQSALTQPSLAATGNLLGSGVASIVPVAAASAVGGPLAGAAVGGGLGISSTKDAARQAGIDDQEATVTATLLAPVQAVLESVGVHDPGVSKLAVRATLREALAAGEGKLTAEALAAAAKKVIPEIGRRAAAGAKGEALTEFLQGEAEGGAKLLADQLRGNGEAEPGKGRYGVTPFDALVTSPVEQALVGGLLGGGVGTTHGVHASPDQAAPASATPATSSAPRPHPIAGTKPIAPEVPSAQLRGRTVVVRDPAGRVVLGEVQHVLDKPEGREFILRNAEGKLSRYPQGEVFVHDASAAPSGSPAGNRVTQALANWLPAPSGLRALDEATLLPPTQPPTQPRTPATDPGPTADYAERPAPNSRSQAPVAGSEVTTPVGGPTLGELVPDEHPVSLSYGGQPVRALRNREGDIELHRADGQVAVLDKGEQFDKPAADFRLHPVPVRVQAGDELTLGSGEFAQQYSVQDVLRNQAGQITAVMVATPNGGSRIVESDTPEGKSALAALNAREQSPTFQPTPSPATSPATLPSAPIPLSQRLGTVILHEATNEAAGEQSKSMADMAGLVTDIRAGQVTPASLAQRLPEVATSTLAEAKRALANGTLADELQGALNVQANQGLPSGPVTKSTPQQQGVQRPATNEGAKLENSLVPGGAAASPNNTPSNVALTAQQQSQPAAEFTPHEAAPSRSPQPAAAPSSPADKRQAALDKIRQRRAQQLAGPRVAKEYTQAYPLRADEPENIRETGHAALQAAEKAGRRGRKKSLPLDNGGSDDTRGGRGPVPAHPRGKAEISQLAISAELRSKGTTSFIGRTINSVADLAEMAQVMRDPRWETFRYYFVKTNVDGSEQIVGQRNISSRMPGATPAFPTGFGFDFAKATDWVKSEMAAVGADGYYLQHNHPSGNVGPSQPDLDLTAALLKHVPGFKKHIIINHRKYTVLSWDGTQLKHQISALEGAYDPRTWQMAKDPLLTPTKPGNLLGAQIAGPESIVALAKQLEQKDGWAVIIGRGSDGKVRAAGHIPLATLNHLIEPGKPYMGWGRGRAALRNFARETGSSAVLLGGLPKPKGRGVQKAFGSSGFSVAYLESLIRDGYLLDATDESGKSYAEVFNQHGRPQHIPEPRVWEDAATYGVSADDLADYRAVLESYAEEGTTTRKAMSARFREDVGSAAETGLRDEHLRQLVKETQQAVGIVPKAKPSRATKERRHAARYDEATRRAFTQDEARYVPRTIIENEETARAYVRQVGLENAYAVALDKPEGFSPAAHIEVQEAVAREYRRLSDEARKAGKQTEADEFWQRSKDVRAAKVSALTEAGQTLAQVQGFVADDPDAVLDLAIKETEKQKKPLLKRAEKAGVKVAAIAGRTRREAMDGALKSRAVREARELVANSTPVPKNEAEPKGYGTSNKYFTKATALAAREALRKLGLSTVIPPELVHFVGYHVEALARAGGNHSFAEVSKRVVRELGAKVRPLLPEAYERARKVYVRNGGADTGFTEPGDVAAQVAPNAVQAGVRQLGTTLDRIAREQAEYGNQQGKTLAERFAAEAGLDPKQAGVYAAAVDAEFNRQVAARKATLRARLLTFSTRVLLGKQAATAVDKLLTTLNLATDPASAGELLKQQLNLPNITPAQADEFVRLAEAVRRAKPGNERSDRVQDLMKALGRVQHVNWFDVTQAMWYANVLSGPLTHATNLTANAKEAIAENLISTLHTWADTGSLRAATGPTRGAYRAQQRAFAEAAKIIATGYTGSQSEKFGHNNVLENRQFTGLATPLNGLKYVQRALVGEDAYFNMTLRGLRSYELALKDAYREVRRDASLSGEKLRRGELYERSYQRALGKLYGLPDLRAAAEAQADAEALPTAAARQRRIGELVNEAVNKQQAKWAAIAESEGLAGVAKWQRISELQEQAQPTELAADAQKFAEIHTFNGPYEGRIGAMGALVAQLGEVPVGKTKPFKILVPFSRILTSVANRRLEWAGLGFIRAIKGGTGPKEYQGGKFYREYTPEYREKAYLRSTLGTVSALALYSLAKAGYLTITGSGFGDKDEEQESPNSSIKWGNGLFTSYKGDTMEIILAAIGNTLEYERKQEKAGKQINPAKRLAVITGLTTMYTLGMTPGAGIDNFNEAVMGMSRNPDKGINYVTRLGTNSAKGLIPYSAGVQQSLRGLGILTDQNQKETASDEAWRTAYNSLVADVPWVRDGLEDAVDILGEPMKATSNRLWGWQPARSATDQAALDYLAEHDLLPARSRITDDNLAGYDAKTGQLRPMTEAEFTTFQVTRGKEFARLLRAAMHRPSDNPDLTPKQRGLIRHYNAPGDKALRDLPLNEARKVVREAHRQAVVVGKAAVFGGDIVPVK